MWNCADDGHVWVMGQDKCRECPALWSDHHEAFWDAVSKRGFVLDAPMGGHVTMSVALDD